MACCTAAAPATRAVASAPRHAATGNAARRSGALVVRAAVTDAAAAKKTLKALNITKSTLVDSNGGRAVRNVDGEIYEVVYQQESGAIKVLCKSQQLEYSTEIGKDSRIAIVLESAVPMAGGAPSFAQLQAVLKASAPGPEILNGRLAMLAFLGIAGVELATGQTAVQQLSSVAGAGAAVGLAAAVSAASLAPLLLGKVKPQAAFPTSNDSYPNQQLPYFWTGIAEVINGRVAMFGLAALLVNEAVRGAPLF